MKFYHAFLFIILLIVSCGSSETPPAATTPKATPTSNTTSAIPKANPTASDQTVKDPVLGGPADFTLKINGARPSKAYLIGTHGEQRFTLDSTMVSSAGAMRFQNSEGYPQGLYAILFGGNNVVQVMLPEDQKFSMEATLMQEKQTMKVEGSLDNQLYYENSRFEDGLKPKFSAVAAKLKGLQEGTPAYNAAKAEQDQLVALRRSTLQNLFKKHPNTLYVAFKKAGQNPIAKPGLSDSERIWLYRKEFWNDVDFSDPRLIRTPVVFNKLKRYMTELTPQNPDSVTQSAIYITDLVEPYPDYFKLVANWIPLHYDPLKSTLMDPHMVYVNMIERYFTPEKAFWSDKVTLSGLQQRSGEMSASLLGKIGPDVISTDPNGQTKSIYEMKSEYVIVYMYNPTCEHCLEQTPKMVQFYNQNKGKGFDVFAIALDTNDKEWKDYIAKNNMTWTNVYDPTNKSIYGKYYVDNTPELYVLNKDRKIIGKNLKVNQIMTVVGWDKEGK